MKNGPERARDRRRDRSIEKMRGPINPFPKLGDRMDHKLKKIMKKAEDMLAAVTFAEEGERETARSFLQEGRRVLLAVRQGRIDAKTVKYAVNSSQRIGAVLDVLYVASGSGAADHSLPEIESELSNERIPYRVIKASGCLKQAIIDHTNREKDILFAVVESPAILDAHCNRKDTMLSELWRKLKCPLVVVMDEAGV